MKRKTFEFGDGLASAFEDFCSERRLVEKQVIESLVAYFMAQGPDQRERILLTRFEEQGAESKPSLKLAAKTADPRRNPGRSH